MFKNLFFFLVEGVWYGEINIYYMLVYVLFKIMYSYIFFFSIF